MSKLKSYQEKIQKFVEHGIDAAEQRHNKVAARPFNLAEKLEEEAKSYSVKSVRQAHNHYAKNVYSSLRWLNTRANSYASDLIRRLEREASEAAASDAEVVIQKTEVIQDDTGRKVTAKKSTAVQGTGAQGNTASA